MLNDVLTTTSETVFVMPSITDYSWMADVKFTRNAVGRVCVGAWTRGKYLLIHRQMVREGLGKLIADPSVFPYDVEYAGTHLEHIVYARTSERDDHETALLPVWWDVSKEAKVKPHRFKKRK